MPIPGGGHNTIQIIEIIILTFSFSTPVCFVGALKLFYILGEAFEYATLDLVFCDTKKIFGLLKKYKEYKKY
jgi:hypothetical protein